MSYEQQSSPPLALFSRVIVRTVVPVLFSITFFIRLSQAVEESIHVSKYPPSIQIHTKGKTSPIPVLMIVSFLPFSSSVFGGSSINPALFKRMRQFSAIQRSRRPNEFFHMHWNSYPILLRHFMLGQVVS